MHSLEERARRYATKAHAALDQRRKYTNEPYIVHPAAVVERVRSVTDDEIVLAAAWLHDTVEDTDSTFNDIESHFGSEVAALVGMLTNVHPHEAKNRAARKVAHFQHTARASADAQTIKLADIIDNTCSIIEFDARFARVYLVEKRIQIALLPDGNRELWREASDIIERGITQLMQPPYQIPAAWFEREARKYHLTQ